MSRIYGTEGLFGETIYTNESGQFVGESRPGIFGPGSTDFYDANGRHVGYAEPSVLGGSDFFSDSSGFVGFSSPSVLGGDTLFDSDGVRAGWTMDTPLGSTTDFADSFEF